jgi:hypothetical protein
MWKLLVSGITYAGVLNDLHKCLAERRAQLKLSNEAGQMRPLIKLNLR